jgi:HEAT repeats
VVRELVAAHEQAGPEVATRSGRPTPLGRTILSRIDDPEAAPALRSLLGHERAVVRGAAVRSLGFSGDSRDVVDVAALLDDEHPGVRSRARSALAELGGTDAADALFASVAALDLVERAEVQAALAWLNDPRDLDATRAAARASLSQQQPPALSQTIHQGWGAVYALLRLGDQEDATMLVDTLIERARTAEPRSDGRGMPPDLYDAQSVAFGLNRRLLEHGFSDLAERCDTSIRELVAHSLGTEPRPRPQPIEVEPLGGRSIPRLAMAALSETPASNELCPARFGGQPDWLTEPVWPLSPSGHPMIFLGQLPLVGQDDSVAYIFFSYEVDETWDPLGPGNAIIVQPGDAKPQVPTLALHDGPQLYERVEEPHRYQPVDKMRPYHRYIVLEPGADPERWEWPELPPNTYPDDGHRDWNKIGGTPAYLQGEDVPPGPGWRFAFQFNAAWAGHEFGDVAECYGFVNRDGRGAFLWQCH